jgi:hypothetical protein
MAKRKKNAAAGGEPPRIVALADQVSARSRIGLSPQGIYGGRWIHGRAVVPSKLSKFLPQRLGT